MSKEPKIKMFTCDICNEQVTRPKSYAMPNGKRACRTHEETQVVHESKVASEKARKSEEISNRTKKELNKALKDTILDPKYEINRNPRKYCWHCDKDGVEAPEFYTRVLIEMQKDELTGIPFNLLDSNPEFMKRVRTYFPGKTVVRVFEISRGYPDWKVRQLVKGKIDKEQLVGLTGAIVLCCECAPKFEFDWVPKVDINLKTLAMMGSIAGDVFKSVAFDELDKEGKVEG